MDVYFPNFRSESHILLQQGKVMIKQETRYPWEGDVVALKLPLEVRRVGASDSIQYDQNSVALQLKSSEEGLSVNTKNYPVTVIPYYTWANRQQGEVQVWLPRKAVSVMFNREK